MPLGGPLAVERCGLTQSELGPAWGQVTVKAAASVAAKQADRLCLDCQRQQLTVRACPRPAGPGREGGGGGGGARPATPSGCCGGGSSKQRV